MKKKKKTRIHLGRLIGLVLAGGLVILGLMYGINYAIAFEQKIENDKAETTRKSLSSQHAQEIDRIQKANIQQVVKHTGFTDEELRACFYTSALSEEQTNRVARQMQENGQSFIQPSDLRCVRILYNNFSDETVVGEIFVNEKIAQDVEDLFYDLYIHEYPLEKVVPVENYGGSISDSMSENNTYGYSARNVQGQDPAENPHAYGMAIDINPLYNPLIVSTEGYTFSYPTEGQPYEDRSVLQKYMISASDYAVEAFKKFGFEWGGEKDPGWLDYKHFQKSFTPPSKQKHNENSSDNKNNADNPAQPDQEQDQSVQPEVQPDQGLPEGQTGAQQIL